MTGEGAATAAVAEGVTAVRRGVVVERGGAGRACTAERQALRLCVRRLCSSSESEHIARHEKSAGGSRTAIIRKSSVYPTQYDGPKTTRCSNATYGPHRGGGGGGAECDAGATGAPRWQETVVRDAVHRRHPRGGRAGSGARQGPDWAWG